MSLPVNLGDAIALFDQICKAYDAYKSTPNKVRQALKKFEDAEKECKALNTILSTSHIPDLRSWPGTEELVTDLKSAHTYLNNFRPLAEDGITRMARIKKTSLLNWKWSDFEKHLAIVDRHRENMKDFKQTVLLQTAQANVNLQISAIKLHLMNQGITASEVWGPVHDDVASITSDTDQISLLSKVSRSLQLARQLEAAPKTHRRLLLSPVLEGSGPRSSIVEEPVDDLKANIARFIENRQLNKLEAVKCAQLKDLEYIARLPEKWYRAQMRSEVQAAPDARTPIIDFDSLALSEAEAVDSLPTDFTTRQTSGDTQSLSPSWYRAFNEIRYDMSSSRGTSIEQELLPKPAIDLEITSLSDISVTDSADEVDDTAIEIDQAMITVPWIKAPLSCKLRLVRSEGSLCIHSSTTKTFRPDKMPSINGQIPSKLLNLSSGPINDTTSVPIIFSHAVLGGMTSFPKILHPTAEIGDAGEYPYVVEFYDHQYLKVEGYSNLRPAVQGLRYLFRRKSDRDLLRQEIFGKELLASIGVSTVQFDTSSKSVPKPCTTQAATLWKAYHIKDQFGMPVLTITIQCSTKGKQTEPDCAREFQVLKWDMKKLEKVRTSEGKELELEIRPAADNDTTSGLPSPEIPGGVLSSGSTASNISMYSTGSDSRNEHALSPGDRSRKSSFLSMKRTSSITTVETIKPIKPFACYIRFTESSQSLIRAKERFIDALKNNTPATTG